MSAKTLCCVLMVKNEEAVIGRCLASILPNLGSQDQVLLCDTGSTDKTVEIVFSAIMSGSTPVTIVDHQWKNFGVNRSLALEDAQKHGCDFFLIVDADMTVNFEPGWREALESAADANLIRYTGPVAYRQAMLLSNRPWKYVGSTHEYVTSADDSAFTSDVFDGITLTHHADGGSRADKFTRDKALLLQEIHLDPNNPRAWFYLARTLHDLGELDNASAAYHRRVMMGGFDEEVYFSLWQLGRLEANVGVTKRAAAMRPGRLEALFDVGHHYLKTGDNLTAWAVYNACAGASPSKDLLLVDTSILAWRAVDHRGIAAMRMGWVGRAKADYTLLLENADALDIPAEDVERIKSNLALIA